MYPTIVKGDARVWAESLPDNYATAIFCDPPYGLGKTPDMVEVLTHWLAGDDYKSTGGGFMGAKWDSFVPGPATWRELLRACKPGAVLLVFGGTKTVDLLSVAIRLGGWEKFDEISVHGQVNLPPMIDYLYGTGFGGKGSDIGKAIDRQAGAEREIVGQIQRRPFGYGERPWEQSEDADLSPITSPATDLAATWEGYNTTLKPSHEVVLCFRKSLRATFAQTAVEHGTGALNIDGTRVKLASKGEDPRLGGRGTWKTEGMAKHAYGDYAGGESSSSPLGRWPANVILAHHPECERVGVQRFKGQQAKPHNRDATNEVYGKWKTFHDSERNRHADADGLETVDKWRCHPDCEVRRLDAANGVRSSGTGAVRGATGSGWQGSAYGVESRPAGTPNVEYGDSVPVSRYFYQTKTSPTEREDGLLGKLPCVKCGELRSTSHVNKRGVEEKCTRNTHPTLKPIELCEYLARLIVPPEPYRDDAVLLVPFAGVASEMIGAFQAGWRNIEGCELDEDGQYIPIAEARIAHWCKQPRLF